MGRFGLGTGLAIAALTISGCGSNVTPDQATPPGVTATANLGSGPSPGSTKARGGGPQSVGSDDASSAPPSPVFPLTVRRSGGIADFDDRVTLRADGRVLVQTRTMRGRVCTLDRDRQRQLVAALGTLRLGAPGSGGVPESSADGVGGSSAPGATDGTDSAAGGANPIVISVVDARGRPADLKEASLASVLTMVASLVSDVTLSQPSSTRCTPGTTP